MKTYTYKEIYELEYKSQAEILLSRTDFIDDKFFNLDQHERNELLESTRFMFSRLYGCMIHEAIESFVKASISKGEREGWFKIVESK